MKPRDRIRRDDDADSKRDLSLWMPRTELGKKVKSGEITTMQQVIELAIPIKEVEVVDKLIPDMSEEIINVGRVQRVTDSGRRMRFRVVMAVGNKNGYVGVGEATGKEAGPTIRKAIERAKLNIKEVKRGCGSWECGCGAPHTVPFKVDGDGGSVRVSLSPAPKGTGLVSGEIARKILALAGIKDVWVHTLGHTRTNINFAHAVVDALVNTNNVKIGADEIKNLGVISGLSTVKEDGKVQEVTN
ncbi:MAG: 30S ribosomal protein S5 [Candidatus Altiarchaeia archaeon]